MPCRRRMTVRGVVQGVGFRPFVHRLASEISLTGFVQNNGEGAKLELQGRASAIDVFEQRLLESMPEGGRIERLEKRDIPLVPDEARFVIQKSSTSRSPAMTLVADRYVCADCLRELFDPADRRYRYPFINCTRCGPRYTITTSLPYDRENTSMAVFEMCPECRREFEDPGDRRYHAQPIACPVCGPSVWLAPGRHVVGSAAIEEAVRLLNTGRIVAVKGVGGFHLAVDAKNESAVNRLRRRKSRPRKPLALMARDLEVARRVVELDEATEALLVSSSSPIVLAPVKQGSGLPGWIAPGVGDLGVMLPYTPLHHLLVSDGPDLLVMTSGNAPSEPITTDNDDALERLSADAFLMHNREISVANDDSVVRTSTSGPVLVRRSRGFVPDAMDGSMLPDCSVLALGALLKVTVTVLHSGQLIVGRHLGDIDNVRALDAFVEEVERMIEFSRCAPEVVAADLHPELDSADFAARRFSDVPFVRVQHHHAHLASAMVEHGLSFDEQVTGIVLDGLGYGADGAIWGGEVLVGGYDRVTRFAHLRYVPQPGGDRAALEPMRMAVSLLVDAGLDQALILPRVNDDIAKIADMREISPLTSSAGRLFDGVAAILGIAPEAQDFEGEAAARLEAVADPACVDAYPLPLTDDTLDTRALVRALVEDRSDVSTKAARFINGLADGLVQSALAAGHDRIALSGGCLVNRLLARRLQKDLKRAGVTVLGHEKLPPGDGGISAGQAACAAVMVEKGN